MLELLVILTALSFGSHVRGQDVQNVALPNGKRYEIASPNYPTLMEMNDQTIEWNLQVANDAKIKLVCLDIRMVQMSPWSDECQEVYLSVDDGKGETKLCGSGIYDFVHKSDGPKLKVKAVLTTKGAALFRCIALNMGDPQPEEIVKMDPQGRARNFKIKADTDYPLPNLDRLWIFESTPGTRMSFQCDVLMSRKQTCQLTAVIFNNGEFDEEVCDSNHFVWFSKENKAKLRIQLGERGWGYMNCLVQAITGPHPDEYENVVSEEIDSSEHGVTPGARQTSCKCGWANKSGARIYHGEETRVNEFPWMVFLYVEHESPKGNWGGSCGASIITSRHVLTAAHCVVGVELAKPENVQMELARHDSRKPTGKETSLAAERIFVRGIYLQKGLYYDDIAIILTKKTIDFSPIIGPICIEPKEYSIINKQLIIMGWGLTEDGGTSSYLRKGKSTVMDPVLCGASPWDVCVTSKPSSFCSGDSGGPLVWLDEETNRYSQVSLVSRGSSCTHKYLISTNVTHFYDWIQQVIQESEPSVTTCHKI